MDEYYREKFFDYISGGDIVYEYTTTLKRRKMLNDFSAYFKNELKMYEDAVRDKDFKRAKFYYKKCEFLMDTFLDEINKIDENEPNAEVLLENATLMLEDVITGAIIPLLTTPLFPAIPLPYTIGAGVVVALGAIVKDIHKIRSELGAMRKSGGKLSIQAFNLQRMLTAYSIRKLIKQFNKAIYEHNRQARIQIARDMERFDEVYDAWEAKNKQKMKR